MNMKVLFFLTTIFLLSISASNKITVEDIVDNINVYLDSGRKTMTFKHTVDMLKLNKPLKGRIPSLNMKLMNFRAGGGNRRKLPCGVCTVAIAVVSSWIRAGNNREQIIDKTVRMCSTFNIQTERVCRGFVETHVDLAVYLHREKERSTRQPFHPSDICGLALYPDCPFRSNLRSHYEWALDLDYLGPKPPIQSLPPLTESTPKMEVLHITDVHIDPDYTPASIANCDEPVCCRNDSTGIRGGRAGYWGDYRDCDTPFYAFQNLIKQASTTHPNVSYIMFTGDSVDHVMWKTDKERNTKVYESVIEEIRKYYPNTELLPAIGNHEPHPANVWVDFDIDRKINRNIKFATSKWIYDLAANMWSRWLPNTIRSSVERGGSYAHEVQPGLVVVSLNNNFCYTYNWWLTLKSYDPAGQLKWLADTLKKAEENGKKVHIMAHIPANYYNCLASWRRQYQSIINRFENTVVAQFHGHDHSDYFSLYYDPLNKTRANSVAFVAGSATSYTDVNPNYRVYTIEAQDGFRVIDHETWTYNLTEANIAGPSVEPNWKKLYSFNDAYNTTSLSPEELNQVVLRLIQDKDLRQQYFRHTVRDADPATMKGCDLRCMKNLICDIIDPDPQAQSTCILPKPPPTTTTTTTTIRPQPRNLDEIFMIENDNDNNDFDLETVLVDLLTIN